MCQVGPCTPAGDTGSKIMVRINLHRILLLVWLQNWSLQEGNSSAGGGRSFIASSSIGLLPPPQEALQSKTSERKFYSGRRTTMTCTSQCSTELLLFCVHQSPPPSSPREQRFGLGIPTVSDGGSHRLSLCVGDTIQYKIWCLFLNIRRTPQSWGNSDIRSVNGNRTNTAPCRVLDVLHNKKLPHVGS